MISWYKAFIMQTSRITVTCVLLSFVAALPAMAGPRTFVSGLGNDANPGTREQPKRTFASALPVTDAGGEIVVLDSAGFASSTLLINKSVSIIAPPGLYAGLRVASGAAIKITAGVDDIVVLRGLSITGAGGGGGTGINITGAGNVHIENCVISGFRSSNPLVPSHGIVCAGARGVFIKDTIARENFNGIYATAGMLSLDRVRIEGNQQNGLLIGAGVKAVIGHSVASGNVSGLVAEGSGAELSMEDCTVAQNEYVGIWIQTGALGRLSNSTVINNGSGVTLSQSSAFLESRQNNTVRGNGTNSNSPPTAISGF